MKLNKKFTRSVWALLGAALLTASSSVRAISIIDTLGFDTVNTVNSFTKIEAYFLIGGEFASPGFANFTDLESVPNPDPSWSATINGPFLIQAMGAAVKQLAFDVNSLMPNLGSPYSFDIAAFDSQGIALAFATVGFDVNPYLIEHNPATYDAGKYTSASPVPDGGATVMLLLGSLAAIGSLRQRFV